MEVIERAIKWALETAGSQRSGYDQTSRWGPNYDCSSFVISAWESAGVPVRSRCGSTFTGNMPGFLRCGFTDVTARVDLFTGEGLRRGDVLLNLLNHTAIYLGDGRLVEARINEWGEITGGQTGNQTGQEITISPYRNYPWNFVYRYTAAAAPEKQEVGGQSLCTVTLPLLWQGSRGSGVQAAQALLLLRGMTLPRFGADGDFGAETETAVMAFQRVRGLTADGIVGENTWRALAG